jgi:hypothetical protein
MKRLLSRQKEMKSLKETFTRGMVCYELPRRGVWSGLIKVVLVRGIG